MSAKEMFEELGYEQRIEGNIICYYRLIEIPKKYGWWRILDSINFLPKNDFMVENTITASKNINLEELQAINKQVEELGWNNE